MDDEITERQINAIKLLYNSYIEYLEKDRKRGMMNTDRIRREQALALAQRLTGKSLETIEEYFNSSGSVSQPNRQ